jgi:hypothetical protein
MTRVKVLPSEGLRAPEVEKITSESLSSQLSESKPSGNLGVRPTYQHSLQSLESVSAFLLHRATWEETTWEETAVDEFDGTSGHCGLVSIHI